MAELAVSFDCEGETLIGIAHLPEVPARVGVLIVVGGPQYRVGSHRQFVMLGRHLAEQGVAAFRFDYRGIGDGSGPARDFLGVGPDIRAALDAFLRESRSLERIYIWGLCDAASAALLYAHGDERVTGLVLCNPWVRTESTYAQAIVKSYYAKQLLSAAFWSRLVTGKLDLRKSLSSLVENLRRGFARGGAGAVRAADAPASAPAPFPQRMLAGLQAFDGPVLLILSGNDLTAAEFDTLVRGDRAWSKALRKKSAVVRRLEAANHTFSTHAWREEVAAWTLEWVSKGAIAGDRSGT
jgi:exosortase A-associated hydrolase 1